MISPFAVVGGTQGLSGRSGAMSSAEVAQPASQSDKTTVIAASSRRMVEPSFRFAFGEPGGQPLKLHNRRLDEGGERVVGRAGCRADADSRGCRFRGSAEALCEPIEPARDAVQRAEALMGADQ